MQKAYDYLVRSHHLDPKNADTLYHLGANCAKLDDTANARKYLQKALQLNPKLSEAQKLLSELKES